MVGIGQPAGNLPVLMLEGFLRGRTPSSLVSGKLEKEVWIWTYLLTGLWDSRTVKGVSMFRL
jgi:hypothetical protein